MDAYRIVTRIQDQDDVSLTGLADGKVLAWVNSTSRWTPVALPVVTDPTTTGLQKWTGSDWSAAVAGTDYLGGTVLTTLGDLLYGSAPNTASRLAGNTTATRKLLSQTGDGTNSAAPAWDTLVAGDLPNHSAALLTSGTVAAARLGSGTADATTFLRGDSTWAAVGIAVGNGISGGTGSRVLYEDASGNLAVSTNLRYDGTVLDLRGGLKVDGSPNGYNGGEIQFTTSLNTVAITTVFTTAGLMVFDHRGTGNTGYWRWANGTNAGSTRMTLDATGNLTISGGLSQSGILTCSAGADVQGGPVGYGGGEIRFGSAFFGGNAIYTTFTGTPILYFDHRGTGNTGYWLWRNGTDAGTAQMTLTASGALTILGALTLGTYTDAAAPNNSIFFGSDHSGQLCRKNSGGTVVAIG